jgi:hypothetical protein
MRCYSYWMRLVSVLRMSASRPWPSSPFIAVGNCCASVALAESMFKVFLSSVALRGCASILANSSYIRLQQNCQGLNFPSGSSERRKRRWKRALPQHYLLYYRLPDCCGPLELPPLPLLPFVKRRRNGKPSQAGCWRGTKLGIMVRKEDCGVGRRWIQNRKGRMQEDWICLLYLLFGQVHAVRHSTHCLTAHWLQISRFIFFQRLH